MAIKNFSALPSWTDIEQSPTYQELDQPQRKEYFDRWQSTFTEVATEDPDNITPEVWDGFKKFRQQKSRDLTGAAGLTAANAEAEEESQTEAPSRVQLAARKRELEAKMGGTDLTRLQDEERTELANLRSVVAATDEDDLDTIEKVANDDQEFHVADGTFFASPKLALDSQRYRETVRNNKALTAEQKVEALMRGRSLREETGARLKADIDAADMAFEDTWLGGMDKFRAFERDVREGNPDATDADVMEKWQKENGAWYSNLGTQMKIGGFQTGAQLVGTYYGLKSMAGIDTENSLLMGQAASGLNEQLAGTSKSTGGATLAADATSMVLTSLATAPAGLAGRGVMAAGRGLVGGAGRFAAAATAGRVGTSALVRAATLKAGGEAAAKITARQVALATTGGLAASSFAAGVQSAGGAFNQYFEQFLNEELEAVPETERTPQFVEEARRRARDGARARALVSGAITTVITAGFGAGFGATGAQKLSAPQVSKAAQAAKEGLVVFLGKSLSKEALSEAGEEGLDALANGVIDKLSVSPGKPIAEIVEETLMAAAAGGLLGAGMSAPFAVADAFKARSDAKKNPVVAGLEQTAADLRKNGASAVADVVSGMAKTMTQEQLDAKAAADAAAAAALLNQQEAPPVDPALQAQFDEAAKAANNTPAAKAPVNVIPAETPAQDPLTIAKSQPVGTQVTDSRGDVWEKSQTGWTLTSKEFEDSKGTAVTRPFTDEVAIMSIRDQLLAAPAVAPAPAESAPIVPLPAGATEPPKLAIGAGGVIFSDVYRSEGDIKITGQPFFEDGEWKYPALTTGGRRFAVAERFVTEVKQVGEVSAPALPAPAPAETAETPAPTLALPAPARPAATTINVAPNPVTTNRPASTPEVRVTLDAPAKQWDSQAPEALPAPGTPPAATTIDVEATPVEELTPEEEGRAVEVDNAIDEAIEGSLTDEEKQEAAIELGEQSWGPVALAKFRQALEDWSVKAASFSAKLVNLFKKVLKTSRQVIVASTLLIGSVNTTSDANVEQATPRAALNTSGALAPNLAGITGRQVTPEFPLPAVDGVSLQQSPVTLPPGITSEDYFVAELVANPSVFEKLAPWATVQNPPLQAAQNKLDGYGVLDLPAVSNQGGETVLNLNVPATAKVRKSPFDQAKDAAKKIKGDVLMAVLPKRAAKHFLNKGSAQHVDALAAMLYEQESTSPKIAQMLRSMGVSESPDTFPWCATSASYALTRGGNPVSIRSARAFLNFGKAKQTPKYGDMVVMWNTNPDTGGKNGWGGHVGFYLGEVDGAIAVLSGNVNDEVNVSLFSKDRVLGYREVPVKGTEMKPLAGVSSAASPLILGALVRRRRKTKTTDETDENQTEEPPTSSLPPVEGQPTDGNETGPPETGDALGGGTGEPLKAKAVGKPSKADVAAAVAKLLGRPAAPAPVVEEAPAPVSDAQAARVAAEKVIQDDVLKKGKVPSSSEVTATMLALTRRGYSNGSPELKSLMGRLKAALAAKFPPESGEPSFLTGANTSSQLRPLPKKEKSIQAAGGRIPVKTVNGKTVGFFTNIPVDAAKQLNGGLVITIPEELRGSVHPDIQFDQATGVVTGAYDKSRGEDLVVNPGDWTKMYNNSTQKADRAATLLQEGVNVAERTGKTIEELMADLIVVNNKIVAASTGQVFIAPSKKQELRDERAQLIKDTRAMIATQSPRIPLIATDLYLLENNPNPVAGEETLLKEYLRLGGETSSGGSYVENLVRDILTTHTFTTVMDLEEQIQAAVRNRATHLVREALKQDPAATIASLKKEGLPRVAFDIIERFADSSKSYKSVISGSLDDTLTTEDSVVADLAEETAQIEIGTRDTLLDYQAAAETPLTAEETEALKGAMQGDPMGESLLRKNPFQARSALRAIEDGRLFKVGPEGVLLFEHGPELNKEELAGLERLLAGEKDFSTQLTKTPNVARFLFDLASLVREALKKVKTEVGVIKFTNEELQMMNLEELFKMVHVNDSSAAALIVEDARQNLEKFSTSGSLTIQESNKMLSALLKGKPAPTFVSGATISKEELAKQRAIEKSIEIDAAVVMAQATVDRVDQLLRAVASEIKTFEERIKELRGTQRFADLDQEVRDKINELNSKLSKRVDERNDLEIGFERVKAILEEAKKEAEAKAKRTAAAPPKAEVNSYAQRMIAKAAANAAKAREAVTSPAPTKATNAGLGMKPLNPEPRITPDQKAAFIGELSAIGLTDTSDIAAVYDALKRLSVKENSGNPHFKALSRLFTERVTLLDGLNGFQIIDAPALAQDVSVVKGVLTVNVAAMTPTLDGTPRGPEALLRGLITHATTTLTAPDAVLNETQRMALSNLEALRQEAIDVEASTRTPGLESRYPGALKDTASFVQAMLTSPEFSGMLQTYQTKIASPGLKSAWGRFWAAIGELFTGKRVMSGSGLHAGLMAAGSLMNNSPSADKVFLDSVRAIIANPLAAFPLTRTAGAKEVNQVNLVNEAVEAAEDPQSIATVDARVAGDDSPESDPKGLGEANMKLLPVNAVLGAAADGGLQLVPRVADQDAPSTEALTEHQALAGLADAITIVRAVDNLARGNPTLNNEGAPEFSIQLDLTSPEAIREALAQITEAIERLQKSSASNRDQFISILEDMRDFLELQANGIVPPPAKFDGVSQMAQDVDAVSLPPAPAPEQTTEEEEDLPYAKPYVETTAEDGKKKPVDLAPFLRAVLVKTGRVVKMVDGFPGDPSQPLFVKHDRSDTTVYVNKSALESLVAQLRARGFNTAELSTHLNALLDREASTLAVLQRFSSGELVATAKSLSYATRKQIIKRVYGITPSDPRFKNYFARGTDVMTEDATADMIQLGADYFRMMRQISETGHTTEDVMDMAGSSQGTFARTVAFMRATSRQFMTWWRAYGDVNATRAILNIDSFLEASFAPPSSLSSSVLASPQKEIPQKHEAKKLVSNYTGRTVDEVMDDAKLLDRVRKSMKNEVLGGDTRQTTPMTVKQARKFVTELGLTSRDPQSIATALSKIADMETVNPALRVIARQLSQHPNVKNLNDLTFVTGTSTQVRVNGELTSAAGVYDPKLHSLELNMPFMLDRFKYSSRTEVAWSEKYIVEVLIHEAAHAATSNLVAKYTAGAKLPAKVTQAIKGLDSLRLALAKQKGAAKFDYQLSNIDEYIAGVMTDTRFVEWISTLPNSVGNNLPGETGNRSLIKRILSRIYQIIFPDLELDSVLEKSLSRVFDIAAHPHIVAKPNAKKLEGSYKTRLFETVTEREEARRAAEEQAKLMSSEYDNELADIEESMSSEVDGESNDPEQDLLEEANEHYSNFNEQMALYEKGLSSGMYAPTPRRFAPSPLLPGKVTGERKATEALKNSLPVMPARVADYLKDSTYFSGVAKLDLAIIEKLIGPSIAKAEGPADFASIFLSLNDNSLPLTDAQRQLSRVVLGSALNRRINDIQKYFDGGSDAKVPSEKAAWSSSMAGYLSDFEGVAKNVWHTIQDVASDSGQMLSVMAIARDLINPRYVAASYRDAATKVNGKKLPKDVDDTFTELQDEAVKAAEVAVKKSPLKKKIIETMTKASGGDPAKVKMMSDFIDAMVAKVSNEDSIPTQMAEWVSEQVLGMLDRDLREQIKRVSAVAGVPEKTFFEEYSDEVKRLVADRINQAILDAAPEAAAMTGAQQEEAKRKALKEAIQEMVTSFEFAPSVERALNESRAKILTRLAAEKGSSPEALQRYDAAKAAVAGMTYDLVPLHKAANIVRRSFEMQDQIYLSMTERNANVSALAATIAKAAGLSDEQSAKVAEAFKSAYEAELNRRIQKVMTNYSKRVAGATLRGRGDAERYSRSERFMRLARLGGLRKEEFYNAMAVEFGLPSYDPAIAEELDREAERIMAMPVGSVQRADATLDMNARIVNETYKTLMEAYGAKAIVKDHGMAWEYLAGIPVAMWKSGVLSGFGSMEVNFAYGTLQSIMDLGFNSIAYSVKAKDSKLATSNLMTLMKAVGWVADPAQRSEVWTEMKRAALTGRTRFASEQSESMLVLERDMPAIDLPVIKQLMTGTKNFFKLLGRVGSVIDATVSVPAAVARQRLALNYALTMSGADRDKIAKIMKDSFSPDELVNREINEILEAERDQFRNSARPDLVMESRRYQLLEQRRAQTYAELTSRLDASSKEDYLGASRESARFANLGTTPTGVAGWIFDGLFGTVDRKTKGLSSIIVSFPRAMGNLLDFSLAMSVPFLSFLRANNVSPSSWFMSESNRYKREKVEAGSIKYHKLNAQGLVALMVQATIGTLYAYGLKDEEEGRVPWFMAYGKGYPDAEKNRQLRYRQPNWSPYTVKIGNTYLSWKDLPGFNLLLGGLASITDRQMMDSQKDPTKINWVENSANASVAFIKAVTIKNSMQGLAQAGELLSDNDLAEAMTTRNVVSMATNFVSGATNPRLIRDVTEIGRGLVSGGEYTLKDTRGFTAAAISLLPANTIYGDALGQRDMVNAMGRPVTNFWFAPLTKRILPVSASDNLDPVITPLASAGLFISPVKATQMSFDTYKDDSDEVDLEGGPLYRFGPEVEAEAIRMFGENMAPMLTPEFIKDLTDQASQGRKGREEAQDRLNDVCKRAKAGVKAVIQERIFARELLPDWQQK